MWAEGLRSRSGIGGPKLALGLGSERLYIGNKNLFTRGEKMERKDFLRLAELLDEVSKKQVRIRFIEPITVSEELNKGVLCFTIKGEPICCFCEAELENLTIKEVKERILHAISMTRK